MPEESTSPLTPPAPGGSADPAATPVAAATVTAQPASPASPIPFDIAEEFGTAKKNLPPTKVLIIAGVVVAIIAVIVALTGRSTSSASGVIGDIASVEVPNQNMVIVAINISITNHGEKPYWIRTMEAAIDTTGGKFTDQAASTADFDRYLQAFPALKQHALTPLALETKIMPGGEAMGTILVTFPVTPDAFANRKSLTATIQPYDQPVPLVLTK